LALFGFLLGRAEVLFADHCFSSAAPELGHLDLGVCLVFYPCGRLSLSSYAGCRHHWSPRAKKNWQVDLRIADSRWTLCTHASPPSCTSFGFRSSHDDHNLRRLGALILIKDSLAGLPVQFLWPCPTRPAGCLHPPSHGIYNTFRYAIKESPGCHDMI
jgi:hypothetical protein